MPKKSILSFQTFDDKQSAHYLADHWPNGRLVAKKHQSNSTIFKFIKSLAVWIQDFTGNLFTLVKNRDIDQADEYLLEWEESVKIPKEIPRRDALEGRREAVKCLTRKIPVYNIDDGTVDIRTTFEEYIRCLTGISVTIRTAQVSGVGSNFPLIFAVPFGNPTASGNFHFIISVLVDGEQANNFFPLPFAVNFFNPTIPVATQELLDKILNRIIPSFCRWTYEAVTA